MTINIPRQVRAALYIILMIGSPIVAYLQIEGHIGVNEVALWLALSAAIALMAGLNLTPATPPVNPGGSISRPPS